MRKQIESNPAAEETVTTTTAPVKPAKTTYGPIVLAETATESPDHFDLTLTKDGEKILPSEAGIDFDVYWRDGKADWVAVPVIDNIKDALQHVHGDKEEKA